MLEALLQVLNGLTFALAVINHDPYSSAFCTIKMNAHTTHHAE